MTVYAEVVDGVCTNVVVADAEQAEADGWLGPLTTLTPQPGIGWTVVDGEWSPPSPTPTAAAQAQALAAVQAASPTLAPALASAAADAAAYPTATAEEQAAIVVRLIGNVAKLAEALANYLVHQGVLPPSAPTS